MNILVITPTGPVAEEVLRELMAPEFSIRILAIDSTPIAEEIATGAEVFNAERGDLDAWKAAAFNVEAVLWCESVPAEAPTGFAPFLKSAGVGHVVSLGSVNAFDWHQQLEQSFGCGELPVRHIRFEAHPQEVTIPQQPGAESELVEDSDPSAQLNPRNALSHIVDTTLRWLIRRHWTGVEVVTMTAGRSYITSDGDLHAGNDAAAVDRQHLGCCSI